MKLVVLGLSLSSSWGNGHATTYRALLEAFVRRGHDVLFLERDVPWYAGQRDLPDPGWCRLEFYRDLDDLQRFDRAIVDADAVILGSYVPDGVAVGNRVQELARGIVAFYDIDTPVTLAKLERGRFRISRPGGRSPDTICICRSPAVRRWTSSKRTMRRPPHARYIVRSIQAAISRPGRKSAGTCHTSAPIAPTGSRRWNGCCWSPRVRCPSGAFVVAGPLYPDDIAWPDNVERIEHLPPAEHAAFYSASRATLNVTRADMIAAGWAPSVRLFEAAACATPIVSDVWDGLDQVFVPDREILLAGTAADVIAALCRDDLAAIGSRGQRRVLAEHSAAHRAAELERFLLETSCVAVPSAVAG